MLFENLIDVVLVLFAKLRARLELALVADIPA